jgi:hypothetical protein
LWRDYLNEENILGISACEAWDKYFCAVLTSAKANEFIMELGQKFQNHEDLFMQMAGAKLPVNRKIG